jgi:ATP-dependent Clp protease ATP-binding subunit ClpC
VVKAIQRSRLGIKDHNHPNSFIFLGNTGTGKTFLAKLLAEYVYGDAEAMIRIDMSEYMESFATSKLIGAPPGYVGYEKGGELTEAVRRKPYSVVLFDEIEKAHKDVFNLMLQMLDEGHLTDRLGRKVDFRNTLIIMTSNVGIKAAGDFGGGVGLEVTGSNNTNRSEHIIKQSLKKTFTPEFLNRIDEIIMFKPLDEKSLSKIVKLEISLLEKRLKEAKGWTIKLTASAIKFLVKNGHDVKLGARPLKRAIQRYIEDDLCTLELDGAIGKGQTVVFNHTGDKEYLSTSIKD